MNDRPGTRSGRRGRVLFVSHDTFWPLMGGGRLRMGKIVERALRDTAVDLLVVAPERDIVRDA